MARPAESYSDQAKRGEERGNTTAAAPPPATPVAPGPATAPPGIPGGILGSNVDATLAYFGAMTGAQGGTRSGPEVMLTRDINGPTKYTGREVYQSNPRVSKPGSNSKGDYLEQNVYRSEEAFMRGSIDEEREDYKEYAGAGFIGNQNERINDAVILAANGDFELYEPIFQAAVNQAAVRQSAGERITVEEILQGWTKNGLPDGLKRGGGGGGGGSRSFVNVDTRVDLTDEGEARRIVNNALTGALGREATKAESRAFMKALNMYEKENPTVTTSKGVASASGTTSTTESEGGFDSIDFADRYAKSQEGYAEYQTATTYLDAFIGALESDSRVI